MPDPGWGVLLLACIPATTPAFPESVRNRLILGTFKARKQIYSGSKWRLTCNVYQMIRMLKFNSLKCRRDTGMLALSRSVTY